MATAFGVKNDCGFTREPLPRQVVQRDVLCSRNMKRGVFRGRAKIEDLERGVAGHDSLSQLWSGNMIAFRFDLIHEFVYRSHRVEICGGRSETECSGRDAQQAMHLDHDRHPSIRSAMMKPASATPARTAIPVP